MKIRQWGIRVPARGGEAMRQTLIREGVLDPLLKVQREGDHLILPVTVPGEDAAEYDFEAHPGREDLPRHELVGGIAILQEEDSAGAQRILSSRPSLHSVVFAKGEVSGEFRTREIVHLAGVPTTKTEVIEHGKRYAIDLAGAYFSARLSTERQRIASQIQDGETILDMFAGVGPFAITLAGRARIVVACDLNPQAVLLMQMNIRTNRAVNVLPVLSDAQRLTLLFFEEFDRIVMNLPLTGTEFLPDAFRLMKPGGILHFYCLVSSEGEHARYVQDLGGEVIAERTVRSYSPAQWHTVYDIRKTG